MIGNSNFEAMFMSLYHLQVPEMLTIINSSPYFQIPATFEMNLMSPRELLKDIQNLYFGGQTAGTVPDWLQLYSDDVFRTTDDRIVRFYANSSSSPIYYYEFAFDGSLNFFKNLLSLNMFQCACHSDEILYLFEGTQGFVADEKSALIRSRMTKMWTDFAKFGYLIFQIFVRYFYCNYIF